jgi:ligand-binding sensor domain-containing protein/signal transduction histidine kinase
LCALHFACIIKAMFRRPYQAFWLAAVAAVACAGPARAVILWSDLGATLVHESGGGSEILGGAVKRDDSASDMLYFKFHVDPLSDVSTEEYFAAFQLYEGDTERLGVGNSQKAWAYSAFNAAESGEFNKVFGDIDLHSGRPESSSPGVFLPYELPRRGIENTIVFKVQYVAGGEDRITVWVNPDLAPGATEEGQPERLTTRFAANASFNQIRLRHGGGGGGWTFGDMAIATSFSDFVSTGGPAGGTTGGALPLTFRTWQREQGLPQNSVCALAQTPDGYLWVGTDDGVARFDGVRFVTFGLREGLRGGRVRVLLADRAGALWIGTEGGGLVRWQNGQFRPLMSPDGLPADSITSLVEDREGRLWIGTEAGLALSQNGQLTNWTASAQFRGKAITALLKDRQGVMWVGALGAGIFRFVDGEFVRVSDAAVDSLLLEPHCLLEDQAGRVWLGAGDDFVLCREGDQWRRYRIPRHLARPYVGVLAEEPDGTVWAGSVSEGLFQFQGGKLATINASTGLSDNFVESMLVDREGNLWVGTGAGLNRVRRSNLAVYGQNEGLGYGPVQGLAEIAPGIIWACKPSDGLYRSEGRQFSRLTNGAASRRYPEVNTLLVTRDGSCWVAGAKGLLRFKDPKAAAPEEDAPALQERNVTALAEDSEGAVWAGTREGELWRWQNGAWTAQTNGAFQGHAITAIVQDAEGAMWVGSDGAGLHRLKGGTLTRLDKHSGLLSDLIRTLYLDSQGTVWIGTAGGGLTRWRPGRMATFTTREGLPDNTISQILEDDSGRLWLGSNRGIACVNKRELEELAEGKIPAIYPQVFGRAEGMLSEECTGGFCPAGLKTRAGLLWFSTLKGIAVVDPRPRGMETPAPMVVLEELVVDGVAVAGVSEKVSRAVSGSRTPTKSRAASTTRPLTRSPAETAGVRIEPGKHRLEFRYTGLSFRAPERVRFRYQLEGLDPDWVEAETRRTAFYSYVPPGEYRFRVAACSSEGVWNEMGDGLGLTVLRHFWQARWFLGLAALGLLLTVGGTVLGLEKRRHRRQVKQLEQERALERERARIAQDLHDDLGSSLTRLSLLSELLKTDKDNPGQVEAHAGKISQSAGQTVRALEEIVWALRPGSDSLQSLVDYIAHFANELFEGDGTRCRLDLPHDLPARSLPPEMRHNVFLIMKEAMTNVCKHAGAKEVRVQAKALGNSLELMVQDDGRGFEVPAQDPTAQRHGLGNMRRRAEAMGGTLTVESAPTRGTSVKLNVRLPAK